MHARVLELIPSPRSTKRHGLGFDARSCIVLLAFACIALTSPLLAALNDDGEVRVPLETYQALWQQQHDDFDAAPAAYALGRATVRVEVTDIDERAWASVNVTVPLEVFEDKWTLVPVLPIGVALQAVSIDGTDARLVPTADGLAWSTASAGSYALELRYRVDAQRSAAGHALALPLPAAAASTLTVEFPSTGLDVAIVPAAATQVTESSNRTRASATLPASRGVLVSWRTPALADYAISRAHYTGRLVNDAIVWRGKLSLEVFAGAHVTVPLLPTTVTLADVGVDGQAAMVLEDGGYFATVVEGRGPHQISVQFQTPVNTADGPPAVTLAIPKVPVSELELILPGRKDISVAPAANVVSEVVEDGNEVATQAHIFVPLTERVTLHWIDAVPEELRTASRANGVFYHGVYAEEGVLSVNATAVYDITHGEASSLVLELPARADVNRIDSAMGGISDWTESATEDGAQKVVTVFFDRPIRGQYVLNVRYEQLLASNQFDAAADPNAAGIEVPLLSGRNLHRQRGMVALLAGTELSLDPTGEQDIIRVGENQLPSFVRNTLQRRVAHTYKYVSAAPMLAVTAVTPERAQGKFDAQVDTLVSIGEVTLKGAASVEIDVKSGAIMALELKLPADLNVLGVTAPSLRSQDIVAADNEQRIRLAFTQEMTGQFRLEVNYERILGDADGAGSTANPAVPMLGVIGAEVEHGRIGIEALTAVEVTALVAQQLAPIEVGELPQQMILKTTNPILLAFKYVQAEPPAELELGITRHEQLDVQVAAVEQAHYTTLLTRDGLSVTTAALSVRNSRRQFLRLKLPPRTEIWSVFVAGKPARPARALDGDGGETILIRMINAADAFPVEIVYATPTDSIGVSGAVDLSLPRPDMVVTETRWDLFVPYGPRYATPRTNMDVARPGRPVNPRNAVGQRLIEAGDAHGQALRITVPIRGVHYTFEKLFATLPGEDSPEDPHVAIRYISASAQQLGDVASLAGVLIAWAGIFLLGRPAVTSRRSATATAAGGALLTAAALTLLDAAVIPPVVLALLIGTAYAFRQSMPRFRAWQASRT